MAEQNPQEYEKSANTIHAAETKDRGLFGFIGNKEEKSQQDIVMTELETKEGEKHTLKEELQHTHSHSSSSSDEEVEGGGERKRKKKKGLRETIKEEISGDKIGEGAELKNTNNSVEQQNGEGNAEKEHPEEKKGFIEKIKEKLPGQHKKDADATEVPPVHEHSPGSNAHEKKGIIDKIKEILPGHHEKDGNEVKD